MKKGLFAALGLVLMTGIALLTVYVVEPDAISNLYRPNQSVDLGGRATEVSAAGTSSEATQPLGTTVDSSGGRTSESQISGVKDSALVSWNSYLAATACARSERAMEVAQRLSDSGQQALAESILSGEAVTGSNCTSLLSNAQIVELLREAAQGGNPNAQLLFFPEAAKIVFGSESKALRDPALLQSLKFEGKRYLEQAASAGNVDAAVTLAYHLQDGFYTGRPEVAAALHYFRIANELRPSPQLRSIISTLQQGVANAHQQDSRP